MHLILQGGTLTEFDETEDELTGTAEATRCSSDVSALINHYRAFSNTLPGELGDRGRGATSHGIICGKRCKDQRSTVTSQRGDTRTRPGKVVTHEPHHDTNNSQPGLFVVIPTRNNELIIGSLVHLCRKYAESVIVVDEDSDDRTREIATDAGAHLVHINLDAGKTQAMYTGFQVALEHGCSAVVTYDSEGIFRAREIPALVADVMNGTADLVIASRFLGGRKGISPYHPGVDNAPSTVGKNPVTPLITDPESTFFAISRKALLHLDVDSESNHPGERMISRLAKKGLVIREIPVIPRHEIPKIGEEGLPLYRGHKVAVVVPAYNEELLIGETLAGIPDFVCRIYVVNDCSKDKTQEVIDYYAGNDDSIIPVQHEQNKGVGAAIVTGYKRAMEDGMDIAAVMAGDHQMDPIIDGKCDYTMGNRLVSPTYRKGMSTWRFFGNSVLTLLTKMASGYWKMMDPQNGYTAISDRALERFSLGSIYPRYGYCNDLLVEGDAPVVC